VIAPLCVASIGSIGSEGHNTVIYSSGTAIVEFKKCLAGMNALPQIEAVGYIARLTAMGDDARRGLYERWWVPFIGIIIVGELDALLCRFT
jgi:hypothetical protein